MKKLIDILFEPEEEEQVVVEAPLHNVERRVQKPVRPQVKPEVKVSANEGLKTKDVLERKPHSRSFGIIDVEELQVRKPQTPKPEYKQETKEYEAQPPISPIFGVLEDEKRDHILKTPQIKSTGVSHLGTVLSPIYGLSERKEEELSFEEELEESGIDFENIEENSDTEGFSKVLCDINVIDYEEEPEVVEESAEELEETYTSIDEDLNRILQEQRESFQNYSLDDVIETYDDETYVAEQEISLFDDMEEETK